MALDRLTKIDGGGISTTSDYRVGIITATKFVGPIEGDVTGSITATDGTFSGNVTIGGTLTYEDVTNIDSVGIITARDGIVVSAGGSISVGTGVTIETNGNSNFVGVSSLGTGATGAVYLYNPDADALSGTTNDIYGWKAKTYTQGLQVNSTLYLSRSGSNGLALAYNNATGSYITANSGFLRVNVPYGGALNLDANDVYVRDRLANETFGRFSKGHSSSVSLYSNNVVKFTTEDSGINVVGTTTTTQLAVTGVSTFSDNVILAEQKELRLEPSGAFKLYRGAGGGGATNFIKSTFGTINVEAANSFIVKVNNNEDAVAAYANDRVDLYHNNQIKLTTTDKGIKVGTGVTVETNGQATFTGIVTASSFKLSDGSNVGGIESDAQRNTVGGTNAGDSFSGTDATDNTILGYDAGTSLTSGDNNVIIGAYAAKSVTTIGNFVAIGHSAYSSQVSSNGGTVAIGRYALKTYTGSFSNVAVGQGAGQDMGSSGGQNTLVGDNAGYGCKGFNSVIIGFHAGSASNTQGGETIIGMQARYNGNNKAGNTAVGKEAMKGVSGGNGSHTTAIGYEALKVLNNGGNQNTALGYQAGDKVNTGTSNVIIGYSAASTGTNDLTNGSNNIIIGKEAAATSATVSNEVTIGDANITRFRIPGIGLDLTSAPPTLANGADNRVVTASSASALNGEANLTFDGNDLNVTGASAPEINITSSDASIGQSEVVGKLSFSTSDPTTPTGAGVVSFIEVFSATSNGSDYTTSISNRAGSGGGETRIRLGNALGQIRFYTNTSGSGTERVRITSSGDFGIGTTSPDRKLDVSGTGNVYGKFQSTNTTGAGIEVKDASEDWLIQADGGAVDGLAFYDLGRTSYRFIMGNAGQFGVGPASGRYGTSGQVLTSQGSGSAVQWATPATNSPAFSAKMSAYQNCSGGNVVAFNQEHLDTDGCYDTSTYRFTPNVAGNYLITFTFYMYGSSGGILAGSNGEIIHSNYGTISKFWIDPMQNLSNQLNRSGNSGSVIIPFNGSSEYVYVNAYGLTTTGGTPRIDSNGANFSGMKLA